MNDFIEPVLVREVSSPDEVVALPGAGSLVMALDKWLYGAPYSIYRDCLPTDLAIGQFEEAYRRYAPLIELGSTYDAIVVDQLTQAIVVFVVVGKEVSYGETDFLKECGEGLVIRLAEEENDAVPVGRAPINGYDYQLAQRFEGGIENFKPKSPILCLKCKICDGFLEAEVSETPDWHRDSAKFRSRYKFDCWGKGNLGRFKERGCKKERYSQVEMKKLLDDVERLDIDTSLLW